ncbi:tRNA epoxyqueuosine(34) reductase QueG [Guyparkeria halophila]|uniref:Epoxyqueuosine reductase n=1 Tax=Guyparkeria halophila TaxID=47960 RepID=A0ABZ0YTJ1_9GAMM|nr:tRNA epoxyqueuosine(34) reductase QueG [Guyparkeria halophila]WQH15496.1 tRNA epoxyqueuosine(34) reductase QueG [Guyparkeria halophila]
MTTQTSPQRLKESIQDWAAELGFTEARVTDTDLSAYEAGFERWLEDGCAGTMGFFQRHGLMRFHPEELVPGTRRVLMVTRDYLPPESLGPSKVLGEPALGYVSRYALGRDYHKLVRKRLAQLAQRISESVGPFTYRAFCDSAPVYETGLAERAGVGWKGKHSLVLNRSGGSWFFLGALFLDIDLPVDEPVQPHCGSCTACLDVCPTGAIVADGVVDARRCISYLTIESHDDIPESLRPLMGNRIYGCDDCQLVCPWNRFARKTNDTDFHARQGLEAPDLVELFGWDEPTFLARTEGSAIRRIGWRRWRRNLAVALGNLPTGHPRIPAALAALQGGLGEAGDQVDRHIHWALARLAR